MRIAVDLMGGDRAPENVLAGVLEALGEEDLDLVLVGDEKVISEKIEKLRINTPLNVHHASQVVDMDEKSAATVKSKRDSSINSAVRLVKSGQAQALVSAGSTGATVAAACHHLGIMKGVKRPALATYFPTEGGKGVLLDIGANTDADEEQLYQFAHMGFSYAKAVLGMANPRVVLLSNGEEDVKGTRAAKNAHSMLQAAKKINYLGYLEGSELFKGKADVIVCDGFVGNIMLKFSEAVINIILSKLGFGLDKLKALEAITDNEKLARLMTFIKSFDYSEYGGALLVGVNGICTICHGYSTPKAVKNAILQTKKFYESDFTANFLDEYSRIIQK